MSSTSAARTPPAAVPRPRTVNIAVRGLDCAGCAQQVEQAIARVDGVDRVDVLLGAAQAIVRLDPSRGSEAAVRDAIVGAGFEAAPDSASAAAAADDASDDSGWRRRLVELFGVVAALIVGVMVIGEWLGIADAAADRIPWPVSLAAILALGWPAFRKVVLAARQLRVTPHTLVTLGALAAILVGEWAPAVLVVFFMRVADMIEAITTRRGRRALHELAALAPAEARLERAGTEVIVPVSVLRPGDVVVVRPGDRVPVDGEVVDGHAFVDQSAITGEPHPLEAAPGSTVFAAALVRGGSLRVEAKQVGADSTFGRVLRLVEEAEGHRAHVQRVADRFSGWYLPVVLLVALLTVLLRGDVLAAAAVLVIACSCAFALATPVAMLAAIGSAARRGLLVKGGRHLEVLATVDVLLLDKTGTLTLGRPHLSDVVTFGAWSEAEVLALAAAAERDSEHPLASAVVAAAIERDLPRRRASAFEAIPGRGVRALVEGRQVTVGNERCVGLAALPPEAEQLRRAGRSVLLVTVDGELAGVLGATDTMREEVPDALAQLRALGVREIVLLTGDHAGAAGPVAERLGLQLRAGLMPEDKIAIVRDYQARGHRVAMVGDGVNDAPALAQADVGIAMGAAGTAVAVEAAHVALLRDDWMLVPRAFALSRRTMGVVRLNIGYTVAYNAIGLTLAALGFIPAILAAAAHSIPDLIVLLNSSRLLRG